MKTNMTGDKILQPGDDIWAFFSENYGVEQGEEINASGLQLDPNFGWCCTLQDENFNEVQAHDFPDYNQLSQWLVDQGIYVGE